MQYTFLVATFVQVVYWLGVYTRLAFFQEKKFQQRWEIFQEKNPDLLPPPVSVVICAKNEEKNLASYLHRILNQTYHSFEVLVIDDYSTDDTQKVLLEYQKKYSYLRIIKNKYIKKTNGKKEALTLGIKEAQHELLLLADADCLPASEYWIASSVLSVIENQKAISLGYGPYFPKKGFLNAFIRFEAVNTAIQYFSFALIGLPYMGVGRNLCYRKSLFEKNGGFSTHEKVASGDDDLFINEVATSENTTICVAYENFNYSEPKLTWSSYVKQKTRHLTTGKYYRWYHQLLLTIYAGTHAWHYFSGLMLLLFFGNATLFFTYYIVRFFVIFVLYYLIFKKLREGSLMILLPVLDVVMAIYYIFAAPVSLFIAKTKQWK